MLTEKHARIIRRARELIARKKQWSHGQCARYWYAPAAKYKECSVFDPEACQFDAYGALCRAAYELTSDQAKARALATFIANELPHPVGTPLVFYTDKHGHHAALQLFDTALTYRRLPDKD